MTDLIVSEVFTTIQGEGPNAGRVASFVRLGLCNLDCAWCDTPYTWDWTGKNGPPQDKTVLIHRSVSAVAADVKERGAPLTVITGGEPMIQAKALQELIYLIDAPIEIETNGTIAPPERWPVRFNVSPKLPSSGVLPKHAFAAMENYVRQTRAVFKFVVGNDLDLEAVDECVESVNLAADRVWVMPEGRTRDQLVNDDVAKLAEACIARGYNFTNRLHVLLWNDARGR